MRNDLPALLDRLTARLQGLRRVAIATSGGVDSMSLAALAHGTLGPDAEIYHAVSPAVPPDGTERVRRYADRGGWRLVVVNAGEFDDPRYRANPPDRCFFCKQNLYGVIRRRTDAPTCSGTNADDLADYRPGLRAAQAQGVLHPYVEERISKEMVRAIAAHLGYEDLAALPASPCLSSRIESGIPVETEMLHAVYTAEGLVREVLAAQVVRCRLRRSGIVVELDPQSLERLDPRRRAALEADVGAAFRQAGIRGAVSFAPYRMGSAFLRGHGRRDAHE